MDCASDGVICTKAMARHTTMSFSFTVCSYRVVLADAAQSQGVRRQRSLDRPGGLNKGEFLAHRNVHRNEDETANPSIEGTSSRSAACSVSGGNGRYP